MTTSTTSNKHSSTYQLTFWITLIRGLLAFVLGLSLLFIPTKTGPVMTNFIGMFWITTGLVSLRNDPVIPNRRLARVLAIIIMVSGVVMVTRHITERWVAWGYVVNLLGAIFILTGVLHIYSGMQIGKQRNLGRTRLSVILGVFEIVLGALFIRSETARDDPLIYWIGVIWALIGGTLIIGDAIYQRNQAKSQLAESALTTNQQDRTPCNST